MQGNDSALDAQVRAAQAGDEAALAQVLEYVQNPLYGLAMRMLWCPEDARDATQEILIRILECLNSFRGESSFMTWSFRVAANHLKNFRKSRMEHRGFTFTRFGRDLEDGVSDVEAPVIGTEQSLLLEEIRLGCTLGMLLCLDRQHRMAYILGEILELEGPEAASILDISTAVFRKRLSRARSRLVAFMRRRCGLFDSKNQCRCRRRVQRAIELGRLDPNRLLFARNAEDARRFPQVLMTIRRLEETQRAVALCRSHPKYAGALEITNIVKLALK
jgi:RNA polymerase sigma factor (sigma-70 family)